MNKKKIIIIVVAVIAALALIAGIGIGLKSVLKSGGKSGGDAKLTVESVEAGVGQTAKVPVKLSGNPGFMGMLLEFKYDAEKLEYISFEKGDIVTDCEVSGKDGTVKLVSIEDGDVDKNGTVVTLSFKVKEGATGSADIKIVEDENAICNYDEKSIPTEFVGGKVTIK